MLGRKKVGKALSSLVDRIDDPIVIALEGKWGTGKTHFLKRWVGAHTKENGSKAITVYFDAFAHDYLDDLLPALVSSLTERLPDNNDGKIQKLKTAVFKLAKPLTRISLAVATSGITEMTAPLIDAATNAASDETVDALEKYWEEKTGRRVAMSEFRDAITALIDPTTEETTSPSSLVFVIDELDRCRPDYALEVLEVIKHFFSVPHVHFILGVNLKALENSVCARYGEKTDGRAYLKKFIQITLELPTDTGDAHNPAPVNLAYLNDLIEEMEVPRHIATPLRDQIELVAKCNHISMRDIGNIVSSISLANEDVLNGHSLPLGSILIMLDLVITKVIRPGLYEKFLDATVSPEDLESYIGATHNTITRRIFDEYNTEYNHEIYLNHLLWLYIAQNNGITGFGQNVIQTITEKFGYIGQSEATELPRKIHSQWLDHFNFYTP